MSSRLQELLRQKALLADHAAWLDREIAREQARPESGPAPAPAEFEAEVPAEPEPVVPAAVTDPDLDAQAEAIIEQYRDQSPLSRKRIQVGCVLYLVAALILAALPFVAVYLYHHW